MCQILPLPNVSSGSENQKPCVPPEFLINCGDETPDISWTKAEMLTSASADVPSSVPSFGVTIHFHDSPAKMSAAGIVSVV